MADDQVLKNSFLMALTLASNFDKNAIIVFVRNSRVFANNYFNAIIYSNA